MGAGTASKAKDLAARFGVVWFRELLGAGLAAAEAALHV